jgi:hypothetical protein
MKISLDWLSQYVDINTDAAKLAEMLTMSGFEVEAVSDPYEHLRHRFRKNHCVEPSPERRPACLLHGGHWCKRFPLFAAPPM